MPLKPPAPDPADYRRWKSSAAALLERQGILSGVMRERQWRRLFVTGATPEDAAERAHKCITTTPARPSNGCASDERKATLFHYFLDFAAPEEPE
jgi:hypothetical protein